MKHIYFAIFISIFTLSCSSDNDMTPGMTDSQKWELVKMTGNFANSETTGSDMEWQETLVLQDDGIFVKQRERDGTTNDESGIYEFITANDERLLELIFDMDNDLIGNCTGDQTEVYRLVSDTMLVGTWLACDGPGLEYQLVE